MPNGWETRARERHREVMGVDGPPDVGTFRTLGSGSHQAAPGTHTHGPGGGTSEHDHDADYAPIGVVATVDGVVAELADHETVNNIPAHKTTLFIMKA